MTTEYLQFAGTVVLMISILIGSYWFVFVPKRGGESDDQERTRER